MKKNIASIENVTTKATRLAPRNDRARKKEKSTIGTFTRISITTKATSATAASANSARIGVEPQPHELPSTSASTTAVSPVVRVAMPGMSTTRATVSSRDSRVAKSVTETAATATGRVRKKMARQLTLSAREPPTTGAEGSGRADTAAPVPIGL